MGKLAKTMNSSPERGKFRQDSLLQQVEEGNTTAEHAEEMIEFHNKFAQMRAEQEAKEEWRENNLEYDLRNTRWICDKAKTREEYAQNLYAAMCNNDFQKLETWPLLKGQTYSCSWRYAGGIVADMREEGDYMDWYCTGIRGKPTDEDLESMTADERARHDWYQKYFVSESVVTNEIQEDLLKLGWKVITDNEENSI
jgi:hypothetical protein